jgi:hypothetical protein
MPPWTAEFGSFWAVKAADGLPPVYQCQVEAVFQEVVTADIPNLTAAMKLPSPVLIETRLAGQRRCFCFKRDGRIISYGWVTHGPEQVGEMERTFNLHPNEAYLWHCGTVPEWRQKGLYSALLNNIIYRLTAEGAPAVWIGASRLNQPSIQGIANAGFKRVLDATYRRIFNLTFMWFKETTSNHPALIPDAYRIMQKPTEKFIGRVAVGWHTGK